MVVTRIGIFSRASSKRRPSKGQAIIKIGLWKTFGNPIDRGFGAAVNAGAGEHLARGIQLGEIQLFSGLTFKDDFPKF
jgi:hypothetical protein